MVIMINNYLKEVYILKFLGVYAENFQSYTRPTTIPFSAGKNLLKGGNDKGKTVLSNMIKVFAGIYKPFDYRGLINKNASKATVAIFTDERTIVTAHITPTSILYQLINWQGTIVFKQWDSWSVEIARYLGLISVEGENICLNLTSTKIAPFINTTDSLNTRIVESISTIPQIDNKLKNLEEGLQVAKQTKKESEKMANYYSIMRRDNRKPVAQLTELVNSLKNYKDFVSMLDSVLSVLINKLLSHKYQKVLSSVDSLKNIVTVTSLLDDYTSVQQIQPIVEQFSDVKEKKSKYNLLIESIKTMDNMQSVLQDYISSKCIQDTINLNSIEQVLSLVKEYNSLNNQTNIISQYSNEVDKYKKQGLQVYSCKQMLGILNDYVNLQIIQRELRLCKGKYHTALVSLVQDILQDYLIMLHSEKVNQNMKVINDVYSILTSYKDILDIKTELNNIQERRKEFNVCPLCHQELNLNHKHIPSEEVY